MMTAIVADCHSNSTCLYYLSSADNLLIDVTGSETGSSANYTIVSSWTTTATAGGTPGRFCYYVDVVVVAGSRRHQLHPMTSFLHFHIRNISVAELLYSVLLFSLRCMIVCLLCTELYPVSMPVRLYSQDVVCRQSISQLL